MPVAVSLYSEHLGEIKRFLESYYGKEIGLEEDVDQWIYIYSKPMEALDMISAVMDNSDFYQIGLEIQIGEGRVHQVTVENHNDIVKSIIYLYYEDKVCENT